ncbi:hypothetical protein RJ639_033960 [Escallonia herrerae]|uniref:DUF4283 domain-containing protein n=1 Tax=Escallonia herrerae TaxID=1293975 RepID=A0AA88WWV5_9ASTE|nr:hypothetical protein RJ639_033960 [Escallonia herrerae]
MSIVRKRLSAAVDQCDHATILWFMRLYPPLDLKEEGLQAYVGFLKKVVSMRSRLEFDHLVELMEQSYSSSSVGNQEGFEGDDPPRLPGLERSSILISVNQQKLRADRAKFRSMLMGKIVDAEVFIEREVQRYVAKYWSLLGDVSVQKINNLFLFHFTTPEQTKLLLDNGPRNIKGCLLVLKPILKSWQDHTIISHVTFSTVNLWVRVVNIPSDCYHQDLALQIDTVLAGPLANETMEIIHAEVKSEDDVIMNDVPIPINSIQDPSLPNVGMNVDPP